MVVNKQRKFAQNTNALQGVENEIEGTAATVATTRVTIVGTLGISYCGLAK